MNIYALGTHSDWYYWGGTWGRQGLQRTADHCAQAGISRLYWRSHNGGQAKYPSQVCTISDSAVYRDPEFKGFGTLPKSYFAYMEHVDYREWDQLDEMAGVAAAAGLEYCHWYTVFEDDHGGHLGSEFLKAHPQFQCRTRDGQPVAGSLDFWFPEVRAYKRRIVEELLGKPASRLLLDFVRRNGTPSADARGDYRYGFNPEKLAAFRDETGLDALAICPGTPEWEQWLEFNSKPLTDFVAEVAALARRAGRPVDLHVWPVDQQKWLALDLARLAREGAVAEVLIGSHTYSYSPAEVRRQLEALRPQVAGTPVKLVPGLPAYNRVSAEGLERFAEEAVGQGCESMLLMESDSVLQNPISDRLRAIHLGKPYHARAVRATRTPGKPDWSSVPEQAGFIRAFSVDDGRTEQETRFQIAHDGKSLYLRVHCSERAPENLLPVPRFDRDNYNALQLGARRFYDPYESIHLFLDYRHQHEDYARFMVDPANGSIAGRCLDDGWESPWEHSAKIGSDSWEAELRIPLATLEITAPAGKTLGFQLVRVQNQPREISAWFNTRGRLMTPADFGHLILE